MENHTLAYTEGKFIGLGYDGEAQEGVAKGGGWTKGKGQGEWELEEAFNEIGQWVGLWPGQEVVVWNGKVEEVWGEVSEDTQKEVGWNN